MTCSRWPRHGPAISTIVLAAILALLGCSTLGERSHEKLSGAPALGDDPRGHLAMTRLVPHVEVRQDRALGWRDDGSRRGDDEEGEKGGEGELDTRRGHVMHPTRRLAAPKTWLTIVWTGRSLLWIGPEPRRGDVWET